MKKRIFKSFFIVLICNLFVLTGIADAKDNQERADYKKIDVDISVNKEDRDVGLKRMQIIDKTLSSELIQKKRTLVKGIEHDYNEKIIQLLNSAISPLVKHTVITHIDVNFLSPEFESQVRASQKVSVSILLNNNGFYNWQNQHGSKDSAIAALKQIIGQTFNIQIKNISITVLG